MLVTGKMANLLLIVMIASVMATVNAACVERQQNANSTSENTMDKVSNFFVEVGCSIKSGAEKVKERVESGYNYLKSKITPDDVKNGTIADNKVPLAQKDDRITFKDEQGAANDQAMNSPDGETSEPGSGEPKTIELIDRTAITAPEMCPKGYKRIDDMCREVYNF